MEVFEIKNFELELNDVSVKPTERGVLRFLKTNWENYSDDIWAEVLDGSPHMEDEDGYIAAVENVQVKDLNIEVEEDGRIWGNAIVNMTVVWRPYGKGGRKASNLKNPMSLRNKIIRLAHQKPELRKDLLPLLTEKKGK